ncbi:MAG: hypothetical protein II453_09955 [Alphaproteobacteria bacterium]|nr:hypothetical protein [Alphaproteobacteria bacterium]MBQ3946356.1 hypothetical protein [Alphaproteobacteria bacterium]
MQTKDIEILLGLTEILEGHKYFTGKDYTVYNALNQVLNDEEFERLHPRDKEGKFAKTNSGGAGSNETRKNSDSLNQILESVYKDNQRDITPDYIFQNAVKSLGLDADKLKRSIEFANNYNNNLKDDTKTRFTVNGEFTEERKKEHKKNINENI